MNKPTAIAHIKKARGFVPYSLIFEIYNDKEEIPQHLIDICLVTNYPKTNTIICSQKISNALDEVIEREFNNLK